MQCIAFAEFDVLRGNSKAMLEITIVLIWKRFFFWGGDALETAGLNPVDD